MSSPIKLSEIVQNKVLLQSELYEIFDKAYNDFISEIIKNPINERKLNLKYILEGNNILRYVSYTKIFHNYILPKIKDSYRNGYSIIYTKSYIISKYDWDSGKYKEELNKEIFVCKNIEELDNMDTEITKITYSNSENTFYLSLS